MSVCSLADWPKELFVVTFGFSCTVVEDYESIGRLFALKNDTVSINLCKPNHSSG
jgi:hypothetical protein